MNDISVKPVSTASIVAKDASPKPSFVSSSAKNKLLNSINWIWSDFHNLNAVHLYAALSLRESIFIVEQNVPYLDLDGKDPHCRHLLGYLNKELVAYMRTVPLDLFEYGFYSLGRVVVRSDMRNVGLGRELVYRGLEYLDEVRGGHPIKISSQLYLEDFYASFGFVSQGESYIEDMIPHIAMIRK